MSTITGTAANDVLTGDLADGLSLNSGASNEYTEVANFTAMPTTAFTIEMELSGVRPAHSQALLSYAVGSSDNELIIWDNAGTDTIHIYINGSPIDTGIPSDSILGVSPHMLSVSWDSTTGAIVAYVDGVQQFSGTHQAGNPITAGGSLVLGQEQDSVGGGFSATQTFEGTISEVRVFNDVRTAAEISANYNQDIADPTTEPGLVANWQMNIVDENPIVDATGNGNDMVANNGAAVVRAPLDDSIGGGDGADVIHGLEGNDILDGNAGDDTIYGGAADDTIDGGAGNDTIYGDGATALSINEGSTSENAQIDNFTDMPTTAFTVELRLSADPTTHSESLLSYAVSGSNNEILLWAAHGTQTYGVHINGVYLDTGVSLSTFMDGTEHQLTTSWDSATGALTVYVDGVQQYTGTFQAGAPIASGGTLMFGQEQDALGGNFDPNQVFSGQLHEIRLFNDVRTATEVADNTGADLANPGAEPGLVANWQMDRFGDTQIEDMSGNGNSLVLSGGAQIIDTNAEDPADGNDTILGGAGDDVIYGNGGADSISGGTGADLIYGGTGNDTIYGDAGNDTIDGGAGADTIYGGDDRDVIVGGAGDVIDGGTGGDDYDILDLSGAGLWNRVITSTDADGDSVTGVINFVDAGGNITGTLNFTEIEEIICFAAGTRILTPHGEVPVEQLRIGDEVVTVDNGVQKIRWAGSCTVSGRGRFAPVHFVAGSCGNSRGLFVSPQHRMLMRGPQPQLLFAENEVLAAAKHLINGTTVQQRPCDVVTWCHFLFDRHEIVFAEGAMSESYHPGAEGLNGIEGGQREELFSLFPELRSNPNGYGDAARMSLRSYEARLLAG